MRFRVQATLLPFLFATQLGYLAGCAAPTTNPLPATGSGCGSVAATSYGYGRWGDGVAIAVWADTDGGLGAGGGTSAGTARYHGFMTAPTGERIDWVCETAEAGRGKVVVNGTEYDLAKGSLFLVSVTDGAVRQLRRDLSHVTPSAEGLKALARDDPDVAAFVAAARAAP